ncbi:retron St85 family RNA-directed DNA polymerase [Bacillus mycoides]|uniref:retron St85 family RNA-directed DNA polymerase n=1 Tax=Bacillus mycoides TaxID=1405 RepID=UPI001C010F00|nr:retron St85 family RNA-directed DNA polymerase [Bacillus mycoides]QWH98163.1 retron St85 family RNA-directed DNA polymerase [Bacillus mycoides]
MNWKSYSEAFSKKAKQNKYDQNYINECLGYAKPLFEKKIPIIYNQEHLSLLVGYSEEYLLKVSNASDRFYRNFSVPKKNGSSRQIFEPLPNLKDIQRWILEEILYKCPISDYAKSYVPRRSTKDNARFHRRQKKVLTLDIKDFFPSIRFHKIYLFFFNLGYTESLSMMLANLCCLNGSLPQGAISSPALSNLIFKSFDKRISVFCKSNNIRYTRYADDLTFSGDFQPGMLIKFVENILVPEGFQLNNKKTRVRLQHQRQEVTGIVVNQKLQAPRKMRRELRQKIHYIEKYGLDSHLERSQITRVNYIKHLLGIAHYIRHINPGDEKINSYIEKLKAYL